MAEVNYPMPAWLNRDPSETILKARALRIQEREANARLAAASSEAAMRTQMAMVKMAQDQQQFEEAQQLRRDMAEQDILRRNHELAIREAYNAATLGLRQAEVETQQQDLELRTRTAARQSASMLGYSQRLAQLKAAGIPETDAARTAWLEFGPGMSSTGNVSSMGQMTKETQGQPGLILDKYGRPSALRGIPFIAPSGREDPRFIGVPGPAGWSTREVPRTGDRANLQYRILKGQLDAILRKYPGAATMDTQMAMAKANNNQQKVQEILNDQTSAATLQSKINDLLQQSPDLEPAPMPDITQPRPDFTEEGADEWTVQPK